jgi:NADH dehydrogenase
MSKIPARVLVLGGSGFVGRALCERLHRAGAQVTVPTRNKAGSARALWPLPRVQLVVADVHAPGTLAQLLPGHDAVVNLVAILHGNEREFQRVHVDLPRQLAEACAQTGVRRVLHVSALGASAQAPSLYQRSKAAGEAVLQQAQPTGALALTVLRPSVIFGPEDRFLNLFANLQRLLPVMPLAGADARLQPVAVNDVADALLRCLRDPATAGHTFEACGPQVYTLRELVRLAGQYAGIRQGRGRPIIGLPNALGYLQALALEMLPGRTLMSRDNLRSLAVDNVASGELPGLEDLGIRPASVASLGPNYLRTSVLQDRLDAFRRAARR